jgi:hypothetical protein
MLKKFLVAFLFVSMGLLSFTACNSNNKAEENQCENEVKSNKVEEGEKKPVIYLYPESKTEVSVELKYKGELTCTYPEYKNGWNVTAYPDGKVVNFYDNKEYSYLFWEGQSSKEHWNLDKGFVVKGEDTKEFLQEKLEYMGLTPKEYNEFIVYWLPIMQENEYNLITFAGKEYEELAPLQIEPEPDSMLRVFMVFKALDESMEIEEQELNTFERKGFTVIEWGGTELK